MTTTTANTAKIAARINGFPCPQCGVTRTRNLGPAFGGFTIACDGCGRESNVSTETAADGLPMPWVAVVATWNGVHVRQAEIGTFRTRSEAERAASATVALEDDERMSVRLAL